MGEENKLERTNGPYFERQEPTACGHYYPDVLRVEDIQRKGACVRVLNCIFCGNYEAPIDSSEFRPGCEEKNDRQLEEFRQKERSRLQGKVGG